MAVLGALYEQLGRVGGVAEAWEQRAVAGVDERWGTCTVYELRSLLN